MLISHAALPRRLLRRAGNRKQSRIITARSVEKLSCSVNEENSGEVMEMLVTQLTSSSLKRLGEKNQGFSRGLNS